jgi:hypothetical protein
MPARRSWLGLLLVAPMLLTGCGTSDVAASSGATDHPSGHVATAARSPTTSGAAGHQRTEGHGTTHAEEVGDKATGSPEHAPAGRPNASTLMVCSPEIRSAVATVSGRRVPEPSSSWHHHHFTCTYRLPGGELVLSVHQPSRRSEGRAWFEQVRTGLGRTRALPGILGLGLPAFESPAGVVGFLKDGMTLTADATALPARIGTHPMSRTDFAYTIASDVLACWTEH